MQCSNTPSCLSCSPINPNQCFICASRFYLNNGICNACLPFCSVCASSTFCTALVNSVGYVLMTINNASILAACDPGCITCSATDPSTCSKCAQGFYFNIGICLPCALSSNCQSCNQYSPTQCTSCFPSDFLNTGNSTCLSCSSPCITCSSISQLSFCTSCPAGYSLNNGTCQPPAVNDGSVGSGGNACGLSCGSCTVVANTPPTCKLCLAGSVLSTVNGSAGTCLPCLTGCSVCSSTSFATCITCFQGNYLDTSNGNVCQACVSNCFSCTAIGCQTCMTGFFLTSDFACQQTCNIPCATCGSNPNVCNSCIAGYITSNSNPSGCQTVRNCTGNCTICPFGYKLVSNTASNSITCLACNSNSNCARCVKNNPSTCTSCLSGYYLNAQSIC